MARTLRRRVAPSPLGLEKAGQHEQVPFTLGTCQDIGRGGGGRGRRRRRHGHGPAPRQPSQRDDGSRDAARRPRRRPRPSPRRRTTSSSSARPPASGMTRSRAGIAAIQRLGDAERLHRRRDRGRHPVHRREPRPVRGRRLAVHDQRRAQRHPAGRVRALHPGRRRLRRRPRRLRHRVHLALVRPARRRLLPQPPGRHTDRDGQGRGRRPPLPVRAAGRPGRAPTSGTTSRPDDPVVDGRRRPTTPAHNATSTSSRRSTSRPTTRTTATPRDDDHPIAWYQEFDGGRSWYTGVGHTGGPTPSRTSAPPARRHPVRRRPGPRRDCAPPAPRRPPRFEQVTLAKGVDKTGEPMSLGRAARPPRAAHRPRRPHLPDHVERQHHVVGDVPVYSHDEDGLQSVTVDPDFATNRWVYLYYAPPLTTPAGDAPDDGTAARSRRARATTTCPGSSSADDKLDLDEPSRRSCSVAGRPRHAAATPAATSTSTPTGNLYLSTGDDSNPFASDGYAPLDERDRPQPGLRRAAQLGQHQRPARQGAADQGRARRRRTRSRPATCSTRRHRRGPSPRSTRWASATRSGSTVDKRHRLRLPRRVRPGRRRREPQPRPRRHGGVQPDHARPATSAGPTAPAPTPRPRPTTSGTSRPTPTGPKFDCDGAGQQQPAQHGPAPTCRRRSRPGSPYGGNVIKASPPRVRRRRRGPDGRPGLQLRPRPRVGREVPGSTSTASSSPVSSAARWISTIAMDAEGDVAGIDPFFAAPLTQRWTWSSAPTARSTSSTTATAYFTGNENSAVYRIDTINGGDRSPSASATRRPDLGRRPADRDVLPRRARATPTATRSSPTPGTSSDGTVDSTAANPTFVYTANGVYTAALTVTRPDRPHRRRPPRSITVGNTAPTVEIDLPPNGAFFEFGDSVRVKVNVTDPEDGDDRLHQGEDRLRPRPRLARPPAQLRHRLTGVVLPTVRTMATTPPPTSSGSSTPATPTAAAEECGADR